MKLSVIIPAHDEEESIAETVRPLSQILSSEEIDHEIIVVNDHSSDRTASIVARLSSSIPNVRGLTNLGKVGFGYAVRAGLEAFEGDAVAIVMADRSDDPYDIVKYCRLLEQGYDCAFGSRFMPGGEARDYPRFKLVINRLVNFGLRVMFRHGYNDTTNACKAYRREVIESVQPLLSAHFNLTVELPLKAVVRGHTYAIVPIRWTNRTAGDSKLRLREMGSRYMFIALYVFLEDHLTRGDYHRGGEQRWRERTRPAPWKREKRPQDRQLS
jgi:dolichol-phosphate mannosyltransferase